MSQDTADPEDQFAGPYAGELGTGLEDLDIYDSGPSPDGDEATGDAQPSSSSSAAPPAGLDIRSTYIMKYLRDYIREACPVLQTNGPRWIEHPSFWLFGKNELSAVHHT